MRRFSRRQFTHATRRWHRRRISTSASPRSSSRIFLGLATPLAFWAALGEAWQRGVLVRGAEVFERLARTRRVFLDKTGTLTRGEMELTDVRAMRGLKWWTRKQEARRVGPICRRFRHGHESPKEKSLRRESNSSNVS